MVGEQQLPSPPQLKRRRGTGRTVGRHSCGHTAPSMQTVRPVIWLALLGARRTWSSTSLVVPGRTSKDAVVMGSLHCRKAMAVRWAVMQAGPQPERAGPRKAPAPGAQRRRADRHGAPEGASATRSTGPCRRNEQTTSGTKALLPHGVKQLSRTLPHCDRTKFVRNRRQTAHSRRQPVRRRLSRGRSASRPFCPKRDATMCSGDRNRQIRNQRA